jgi:hypothetical protein
MVVNLVIQGKLFLINDMEYGITIDDSNSSCKPQIAKPEPTISDYGTNTYVENFLRLLPVQHPIVSPVLIWKLATFLIIITSFHMHVSPGIIKTLN